MAVVIEMEHTGSGGFFTSGIEYKRKSRFVVEGVKKSPG